jgi:hypothetical protein
MSLYSSLFTVAIPENCTSEFREIFEATMQVEVAAYMYFAIITSSHIL